MGTIAVPENLHATIDAIRNCNIAFPIQRDTAHTVELPRTTTFAAHAAHIRAVAHAEHYNTPVDPPVVHEHVPPAVNRNTARKVELPIATTFAAKGSNVVAVAVSQNLHPMIIEVGYNDVAGAVKRDASGLVELPCA